MELRNKLVKNRKTCTNNSVKEMLTQVKNNYRTNLNKKLHKNLFSNKNILLTNFYLIKYFC